MRVFSGIQPTGKIHIGNYLSAIRNWLELQKKYECFFSIVDLHAITVPYNQKELPETIYKTLAIYLASGLNPEKSIIFLQSQVKEHTELTWLLSTITPLGELQRMTQFKDKTKKIKKEKGGQVFVNAALLNYPILMASDILLYQADIVPVGQDQRQHVELTRMIARKFNRIFGKTFKIPEVKIPKIGAKIMSLTEPTKKMSKSDPNQESCIFLLDSEDEIRKKIMKAVTDSEKIIKYDPKRKPGISNLLVIYSLLKKISLKESEKRFQGKSYKDLKTEVGDLLVKKLKPIRQKAEELQRRKVYLKEILDIGQKKAQKIAQSTLEKVKRRMGLTLE